MPKLHFPQLEFATHSRDLPEGRTTVGRSSRNNLALNDPSVSANHCELVVNGHEVILRDHGSSNGTWVAGERVNGQLPADHGNLIRFGRVDARLELDGLPDDDAAAVTANIAASRAAWLQVDPASFRKVFGHSSPNEDTRSPTISIPEPAKPTPPTAVATPPSPLPDPKPSGGASRRWLLPAAVLLVVILAIFGILRMIQ